MRFMLPPCVVSIPLELASAETKGNSIGICDKPGGSVVACQAYLRGRPVTALTFAFFFTSSASNTSAYGDR